MIAFTPDFHFDHVFKWCRLHAEGECSVLVNLPVLGVAAYVYIPRGPLYRRLNGPALVGAL